MIVNGHAEAPGRVAAAEFLADQPCELACAAIRPDDMAFWMYSSGATGRPKGIVHLHHDMAYTQASFGRHVLKLRPEDICFSVPKIYFAYGFGNWARLTGRALRRWIRYSPRTQKTRRWIVPCD